MRLLSSAFKLLMVLLTTPATAPQNRNCAPREAVVERLARTYGESRQSIGLGEQGMVIETFASSDTSTWAITVTTPNGLTCLVASGQSWEELAETLPKGDPISSQGFDVRSLGLVNIKPPMENDRLHLDGRGQPQ